MDFPAGDATQGVAVAEDPRAAALEKLFTRISEISSLPAVAQQVIELAADETSDAKDMLQAMEGDPALAAKILQRVNSSYFNLPNKVADLQQAITLLGLRELRSLALTIYVSNLFGECGDYLHYRREDLWAHSIAVASASRLVSQICRQGDANQAYLGGLLHDIGLILLDEHLRKHFCKVVKRIAMATPTPDVERELLPFDHCELGAFVAARWSFPEAISDAIRFHHEPQNYDGPHRDTVFIVSVSNHLCSRAGFTALGIQNVPAPNGIVYAGLGLDEQTLAKIWKQLATTLKTTR